MHVALSGQQCGQHTKDMDTYGGWPTPRNPMSMKQGYEVAKMNPVDHHHHHHHHHHNNLQKGHMIDDGRLLDHHTMQTGAAQMSQLYGARGSSSSNSPGGGLTGHGGATNPATALLVVPQPINATKIGATGLPNGTGRKYQCKMCPQVGFLYRITILIPSLHNELPRTTLTCSNIELISLGSSFTEEYIIKVYFTWI
uniref:Uncharacterized protein n=1 Tax=Anopheles maculatus TaxID=74869 RepID=A0A182T625_9DIPT